MVVREWPILKPRALRPGDTVGITSPSGVLKEPEKLPRAIAAVEAMGYRVIVGESCGKVYGYLSGDDKLRARDLNRMFEDPHVDAVFCLKGGYGTPRILDMLDYDIIRAHPKIFAGYSDITALHIALGQNCGLITLHSPMASSDMSREGWAGSFSHRRFERAVTGTRALGKLINPPGETLETLVPGRARGRVVGGNLSLISHLMGTPYELDTRGKILLIEDVAEHTYRIDVKLNQLRLAGKFDQCAGVILGDFTACEVEHPGFGLTLMEIFRDIIAPSGKPTLMNLKAGHCAAKLTLPLGAMCEIDANNQEVKIVEAHLSV